MGAINNDDYPRYLYASSMADRRVSKQVHDNVHGNIYLDPLSLKFVDTEQFQRQVNYLLRDLKQLGLTYLVYPGAVHSRFEHSLGVYWLAGETIHKIKIDQGSELGIDHFDIQTVKLAGLLHDVGHGPFSHMFEKEFLPKVRHNHNWSHEQMSLKMIDYIVDEHNIEIDPDILKKLKEMIVSSSEDTSSTSLKEKRFLYDIVANGRNGIDVDKFDYIVRDSRACGLTCCFRFDRPLDTMRVIGDEICYRAKEYLTIYKLFSSRADLHRTVYTHAKVKAIELMFVDALTKAHNHLDILSCIDDPAEYWKLDDSIMKHIETTRSEELKESRDLISRIRRRDLYQFCNEFTVPKDQLEYFKDVTPQDIICSQKAGVTLKEEDIAVSNIKIDMTRGRKNPLESINFFKDYECNEKFPIPDERISLLLPECFQDKIVRVYSKKPELV
uniref:HD domain-containing protein n=1 Tax=Daucus carota subsp. sativus TaxID=79200 RepID=A0A166E918_DAUCS